MIDQENAIPTQPDQTLKLSNGEEIERVYEVIGTGEKMTWQELYGAPEEPQNPAQQELPLNDPQKEITSEELPPAAEPVANNPSEEEDPKKTEEETVTAPQTTPEATQEQTPASSQETTTPVVEVATTPVVTAEVAVAPAVETASVA